jgi:hypothetical protein
MDEALKRKVRLACRIAPDGVLDETRALAGLVLFYRYGVVPDLKPAVERFAERILPALVNTEKYSDEWHREACLFLANACQQPKLLPIFAQERVLLQLWLALAVMVKIPEDYRISLLVYPFIVLYGNGSTLRGKFIEFVRQNEELVTTVARKLITFSMPVMKVNRSDSCFFS